MSGIWINEKQVEVYMKSRKDGRTQLGSASRAGISERTARDIEKQRWTNPRTKRRQWRTRPDPLMKVWASELQAMLEETPNLQAITLLEYLQDKYSGEEYPDKLLRTLQRRVKQWKAIDGPAKEVIFRQSHAPGRLGLSDFTHLKNVTVTINGKALKHILYHFRLAYSHWSYMRVTLGGESYTALAEGLQSALWRLGGSPQEHRTDSLSAAYKNLNKDEQSDITRRYQTFCSYYQMQATRNTKGVSHENGAIEAAHGHIKRRIEQAFLLRGSTDFDSVDEYQRWLDEVVSNHNCRNAKTIAEERRSLQKLPEYRTIDYTDIVVKVTSSSTIDVRRVTYTVPSQLQHEVLRVRLYDDRLECYLGSHHVVTLERIYPTGKQTRARCVDYRHVIDSLIKKPQAFRYSRLREELLPSQNYKSIWQHVDNVMSPKEACRFMVGLLHLAAKTKKEGAVAASVIEKIADHKLLTLHKIQEEFDLVEKGSSVIEVQQHKLADYDRLISNNQEVSYDA